MSQAIIIEKKLPSRSKNTANYLFSQDGLFLYHMKVKFLEKWSFSNFFDLQCRLKISKHKFCYYFFICLCLSFCYRKIWQKLRSHYKNITTPEK